MRFPVRIGRGVGFFAVALSLLGAAPMQLFGQVTASLPGLPAPSMSTKQSDPLPLAFVQSAYPNATLGVLFNSSVQVVGGSGLLTITVSGDLPPGLAAEIGLNTVAVGGVPTQAGQYTFQISIRDTYGAALQGEFTIQVLPGKPQSMAQTNSPKVIDNETFNFSDAENVFFPVVIADVENFNFTDKESDMDAVRVLDNETITLTDTEGEKESAFIVDRETITLTDTEGEAESAFKVDSEQITLTDTDSFQILTLSKINWAAPSPILYGTALSATQLDATASVLGSFNYTPPAGTVLPPGVNTLSVTFTPNNPTEYTTATASVSLTVNQPPAITSANNTTFTVGTSGSFTVTASGYPNSITFTETGALPNGVTFSTAGLLSGTPAAGTGGSYPITITASNGISPNATQSFTLTVYEPPGPATLTSPTPGTTLSGSSATFSWNPASATEFGLYVGTTGTGSQNIFFSGVITALSANVPGLPTYGQTIYVRLSSKVNGAWLYNDYTYTAYGTLTSAFLTTPTPGSTLAGSSVTFSWNPASATEFDLYVGTTGVGSQNIFTTGAITVTSATVTGLPVAGQTVYVRLTSKVDGVWETNDYTYVASGPAALTAPTPGSKLAGSSVTFSWNTGSATEFDLYIGTTGVGSFNIFNSGIVTATSASVTDLPVTGQTVNVRLSSKVSGVWQYQDYTYTAYGTPTPAFLTAPTPGSTLAGSSVTFSWNAGSGTEFDLYVGTTGVGSQDVFTTNVTTATSAIVTGLPTYERTVYVRLGSKVSGVWKYQDYTYTASGTLTPAFLTTPTPGTTLSGSSATFSWNPASGTEFGLYVGTTGAGSQDIFFSGVITATSANVPGLPTYGQTINVRLSSKVNGTWQYNDYTYTASGSLTPAFLTTPTPGSTLAGSSVTFSWNAASGTEFDLYVGTNGVGSQNIFTTGAITVTSATVTGLPVAGQTVYVRLTSKVDGVWETNDYTYVAE